MASIFHAAKRKATTSKCKQCAKEQHGEGNGRQSLILPGVQLCDAPQDNEAQQHRPNTDGGEGESDVSHSILHNNLSTVLRANCHGVCSGLESPWLAMGRESVPAFRERGLRAGVGRSAEPQWLVVKLKPERKADT